VFARSLSETGHIEPNGTLFHGYHFRLLKPKTGNNVVLAYAAKYRASGVMTFVVNKDRVYERDLVPETIAIAQNSRGVERQMEPCALGSRRDCREERSSSGILNPAPQRPGLETKEGLQSQPGFYQSSVGGAERHNPKDNT
jgi:hypothetical protein